MTTKSGDVVRDHGDANVQVSVLGRIDVRIDGREVDLGTPRQRAIMAALALAEGRPVAFDTVVQRIWGDDPPATAVSTLQRYVASLRAALEPGRRSSEAPTVLVTLGTAYALRTGGGVRDVDLLHRSVAEARQLLATVPDPLRPVAPAAHVAEVERALETLTTTLRLWRGEPYADLGDHDSPVVAERSRLHDLRSGALELRLVALLALGRHAETLGDLESMTALHPLHERWWALRAVALVRSGRQAEALDVLGQLRTLLADELGVDPSQPLQDLVGDILRQAPSVGWPERPATAPGATATAAPTAPAAAASRPRRPAPPRPRWSLVGRSAELRLLEQLVDPAQPGARSALVTGEAGIGKTRLVQELVAAAHDRDVAVATARCSPQAPALWPLQVALEQLGVDTDLTRQRPDDFTTWQQVADGLRAASRDGAVLVVVEDLQWADDVTLRLLEHLVAGHELPDVALVATRRTGDGDDPGQSRFAAAVARSGGARIDLGGLPARAARDLAVAVNPGLDDVDRVCGRTGGNPFFVVALAQAEGRIGGGLADVVRTRVAALDDDTRATIGAVSTVSGAVDPDQLAAVLGCSDEEAASALEPAVRAGVLVEVAAGSRPGPTTYRFAHEVVREVVHADLPLATRSRWRGLLGGIPDVLTSTTSEPLRRSDSWPTVLGAMRDLAPSPALAARAS